MPQHALASARALRRGAKALARSANPPRRPSWRAKRVQQQPNIPIDASLLPALPPLLLSPTQVAILAGDFLLARASVSLASLRNNDVVMLMSQVLENLVAGEILQVGGYLGEYSGNPGVLEGEHLAGRCSGGWWRDPAAGEVF